MLRDRKFGLFFPLCEKSYLWKEVNKDAPMEIEKILFAKIKSVLKNGGWRLNLIKYTQASCVSCCMYPGIAA